MTERVQQHYLINAVIRAQKVMEAFEHHGEPLRLREVVERSGFSKNLCFQRT